MVRKIDKSKEFDVFELLDVIKKSKKDKTLKHKMIIEHPHQVMRWWFIDGRNIARYEHLYYKEKSELENENY